MFGSLFGKKNSAATVELREEFSKSLDASDFSKPSSGRPLEPLEPLEPVAAMPSPPAATPSELDGLPIEDYARCQGLSTEEVWNKLRRGQLVGRTSRGKVLVYESIGAAALAAPQPLTGGRHGNDGDLPPLEFGARVGHSEGPESGTSAAGSTAAAMIALDGVAQTTELALLLDHLSLAKEENREILRLTQDTLTKLSSMTDAVVQMKDEVIKNKDVQLAALQQALEEKEKNLAKLRQEKEDLEILNKTLGTALGNAAGLAT